MPRGVYLRGLATLQLFS